MPSPSLLRTKHAEEVSLPEIRAARDRIRKYVYDTPFYQNLYLSRRLGAEIYTKLECYQPTGVFKIRGAFNIELENLDLARERGVITASSGNHGLSVAFASRTLGIDCQVVVTLGANPDKVKMIKLNGAGVIEGGPTSDSIISKAREISRETGRFFIHPFDDPSVVAGQGTCALEMDEQVRGIETVIVPVGGGGLIAGVASAYKAISPECRVIGVQAEGVPSLYESLNKGELVTIRKPATIADGLLGQTIGRTNFAICKQKVDDVLLVSDESMREAVKTLLFESHVLAEPSGAAPIAALLTGAYKPRSGEKVAAVVSGGNIAYTLLGDLLNEAYPSRSSKRTSRRGGRRRNSEKHRL